MSEIILAIVIGLIINELSEISTFLAKKIVRYSIRFLPKEDQARCFLEWMADIEDTPGKLLKLANAITILFGVRKLRSKTKSNNNTKNKISLKSLLKSSKVLESIIKTNKLIYDFSKFHKKQTYHYIIAFLSIIISAINIFSIIPYLSLLIILTCIIGLFTVWLKYNKID